MSKFDFYTSWKNWDKKLFGQFSSLEKVYYKNILKLASIGQSSEILEIGFGNGSFLGFLNENNLNFVGVETNEKLIEIGLRNNFDVYGSIDNISKNKKFDFIALFDVIEHIPENEIEKFFEKISQRLNKNGSIFLRFPNGSSPLGLANQHGDVTHCNIVTLPKLNFWCSKMQLEIINYRGDIRPFLFRHNFLKAPSKILKLFFYSLTEKYLRFISNQSKAFLSSNLEVIIKKVNES